ncbi:MAG: winged helix-turn-helix transcriptional regulator [Pirellulaceae bacterium]|nr:winged helix-turn-helix transcriptional regulator [Pirellulaceae bacterium]
MPLASPRLAPSCNCCEEDADRLLEFIHAAGGAFRRLRCLLDEQVQPLGLVGAECLVLWLCATRAHHAGWAQQDLATAVGVSPALMSSMVEGLRKRGLMEMKRSAVDRRRQVWRLLAQGEDLLHQVRGSLSSIARQLDDLVSVPEQQATQEVFARLSQPIAAGAAALHTFDPDGLSGPLSRTDTREQGGGQ